MGVGQARTAETQNLVTGGIGKLARRGTRVRFARGKYGLDGRDSWLLGAKVGRRSGELCKLSSSTDTLELARFEIALPIRCGAMVLPVWNQKATGPQPSTPVEGYSGSHAMVVAGSVTTVPRSPLSVGAAVIWIDLTYITEYGRRIHTD